MSKLASHIGGTVALIAAFAANAADTCHLTRPPLDAAITADHGFFFFVYPRTLGENYNGCQIMWDEKGKRVWTAEFSAGQPMTMTILQEGNRPIICSYADGKLTSGPEAECLEPEELKKGIPSMSKATEPRVPRSRDPRR